MDISQECQVIELEPGIFIYVEAFSAPDGAPEQRRFNHVHPLCELVWFRRTEGFVYLDGVPVPLEAGQAIFLPSMQAHDFETGTGVRDWVFVQFEPFLAETLFPDTRRKLASSPFLVRPDPISAGRLDMLLDWLMEISGEPSKRVTSEKVLELIMTILALGKEQTLLCDIEKSGSFDRIRPAIALINGNPGLDLDAAMAARACNLTVSYFLRLFKSQMGVGFSSYLKQHRLNAAARLILNTDKPISQIGYAVGFSTPAHFSASFSDRFGVSPRDYRKSALGAKTPELT
ncbi:MAG: AraC family transcriptional regulator [Paracoccaceae bacterium]|nr:AraC family transcriptional regulator [Paracoccaceae bacterium]